MIENTNDPKPKINVILKDGTEYLGKKTTERPFGEHDRIVGFWDGDALVCIPMSEVKRVAIYFDYKED